MHTLHNSIPLCINDDIETMSVAKRAEEWQTLDPNPATKEYVGNLLKNVADSKVSEELNSLFPPNDRIGFGTAGLRSNMTPGPMGMNDLVVIQAAQGIAKYVLQENNNKKTKHQWRRR